MKYTYAPPFRKSNWILLLCSICFFCFSSSYLTAHTVDIPVVQSTDVALCGTYTIGNTGAYTSLSDAVNDFNSGAITCAVVFELLADYDPGGESFPIVINQNAGSSAVNTLTIRPGAGVAKSISASSVSSIIKLNGADYVIIDGSNNGTNSQNLTIANTNNVTSTAVIWIASLGAGQGSTHVTIKNCKILAGSNTLTGTYGIYAAGTSISTSGTGADNDNLRILNDSISKCWYGIFARGVTTAQNDSLVIAGNFIGSNISAAYIGYRGIDIQSAVSPDIYNNTVFNLQNSNSYTISGIELGLFVQNALVHNNLLYGYKQTATTARGAYGINISNGGNNNGAIIYNNIIYNLLTDGGGTVIDNNPFGIRIAGGNDHKVYFNSIHLYGSFFNNTTTDYSACFVITSSTLTGIDIRNNVFSNVMTGGAGARCYAIYISSGLTFGTIDYNDYYFSGPNGYLGTYNNDVTLIADWRIETSQDVHSLSLDPVFTSNTNLMPVSNNINGTGITIAGYPTDFYGTIRNVIKPDMGAIEFTGLSKDLAIQLLLAPAVSQTCFSDNETVTISVINSGSDTIKFYNTPVTFTVISNGPNGTQNYSIIKNTGYLAADGSMNITITGSLDMMTSGTYAIEVFHDWLDDLYRINDTLKGINIQVNNPFIDNITSATEPICAGSNTQLGIQASVYGVGNLPYAVSKDSMIIVPDNNVTGIQSLITVSGANMNASDLYSVTLDSIKSTNDADLDIYLIAPNGSVVELTTDNGGTGDNYLQTNFAMWAVSPITIGTAPFTSDFIPEGNFNSLTGSANGTWKLKVVDDQAANLDTVYKWTLHFMKNQVTAYTWWPSQGLNDTTIANPIASPTITKTYHLRITDEKGCLSSAEDITVTVSPVYRDTIPASICNGDSIYIGGSWRKTGGYYATNLFSINGCDSIVVTNLSVKPVFYFTTTHAICDGDTYNWRGNNYSVAGTYFDSYNTIMGCDSIYELQLSVNPSYHFIENVEACSGQIYTWHGTWFVAGGVYYDNHITTHGCDSIYELHLTFNPVPVVNIGHDTTLCANQSIQLNAGNTGSSYSWSTGETSQNIVLDSADLGIGTSMVWVSVDNGCVKSDTILITFDLCTMISENDPYNFDIYPNPTDGLVIISSNAFSSDIQLNVYNTAGKLINTYKKESIKGIETKIEVDLSSCSPGIYSIVIFDGSSYKVTKVIRR
jgi:subtilisin-like proprotein convertase family protein